MPAFPKKPVIDVQNPFYCPSLPARAYIHKLHQDLAVKHNLFIPPRKLGKSLNPFARLLAQAIHTPGLNQNDKGVLDSASESDTSSSSSSSSGSSGGNASTTLSRSSSSASEGFVITGTAARGLKITQSVEDESGSGNEQFHSASSRPRVSTTSAVGVGSRSGGAGATASTTVTDSSSIGRFGGLRDSHLLARPPRKRKQLHHHADSDSDSDIRGPSKLVKSSAGSIQKSFEVRLKRQTLNFDLPSSAAEGHQKDDNRDSAARVQVSPVDPAVFDWLLSPRPRPQRSAPDAAAAAKDDTVSTMTASGSAPALDVMCTAETSEFLEKIKQVAPLARIPMGVKEPQAVANYLGKNGLFTTGLMGILGMSDVKEVILAPSLQDHNGLNIGPPDLFREFHGPGVFKSLTKVSCDGVPVKDDSIVHLHGLPLEDLRLVNTGISNTAVFALVPLRRTLLRLLIGTNGGINDDAIPALITFKKLIHLGIERTNIYMKGLRRFAQNIHSEGRKIRIEIPRHCQYHLEHMHEDYLITIPAPLISSPLAIDKLHLPDLRKNLAAHSRVDRTISTTGNKAELKARLMELLVRRQRDLDVKRMWEEGLALDFSGDGDSQNAEEGDWDEEAEEEENE